MPLKLDLYLGVCFPVNEPCINENIYDTNAEEGSSPDWTTEPVDQASTY